MSYFAFFRDNRRFLSFGFTLAFVSSFGQTFFIALFGADIRAEYGLSHGDFGLVYSLATVTSALMLIVVGRRIDTMDLRLYAALACAGLAFACVLMGFASGLLLLLFAVFALRFTGQGLMSHMSATSMARYFDAGRGKAVSFATLGLPVGEGILPLVGVALIAALGWRQAWMAIGVALALVLVPLVLWLLRGHGERHRRLVSGAGEGNGGAGPPGRQWTHVEMLRDLRFYSMLPAVLAPPFILTGFFFHQAHLAASKGWSLAWLATCFAGFAAAKIATTLVAGPMVDRLGAARLLPWSLPPLALALVALGLFTDPAWALVYMVGAGVATGAAVTVGGALWAEIYGVTHVGANKAVVAATVVVATALAPVLMGWLIDAGVTVEAIAWMSFGCLAAAGLILAAVPRAVSSAAAS